MTGDGLDACKGALTGIYLCLYFAALQAALAILSNTLVLRSKMKCRGNFDPLICVAWTTVIAKTGDLLSIRSCTFTGGAPDEREKGGRSARADTPSVYDRDREGRST